MNNPEARLLEMKRQVAEKKDEAARLKGVFTEQQKVLKGLGCKSLKDAKEKAQALEEKVADLREKAKVGLEKLESDFDWE